MIAIERRLATVGVSSTQLQVSTCLDLLAGALFAFVVVTIKILREDRDPADGELEVAPFFITDCNIDSH
jgi:hypothetical protein